MENAELDRCLNYVELSPHEPTCSAYMNTIFQLWQETSSVEIKGNILTHFDGWGPTGRGPGGWIFSNEKRHHNIFNALIINQSYNPNVSDRGGKMRMGTERKVTGRFFSASQNVEGFVQPLLCDKRENQRGSLWKSEWTMRTKDNGYIKRAKDLYAVCHVHIQVNGQ